MNLLAKHALATTAVLVAGVSAAAVIFVWSGAYDIGADDPHTRPVFALLTVLRERSMETRAAKLVVPDLTDPANITQGAGNYAAMCAGCHLAPGAAESELSKGLYPTPPNLSHEKVEPNHAFWAIKHGIKASGMAAWGKSMDEQSMWNLVAFVQKLPQLDEARYDALVDASGGHSHGGGEGMQGMHEEGGAHHAHEHGEAAHHDGGNNSHAEAADTDDGGHHAHPAK